MRSLAASQSNGSLQSQSERTNPQSNSIIRQPSAINQTKYQFKSAAARCGSLHARGGFPALPGCFANAGDLALVGQLTEADTADTVLAEVSMGTTADLAAVVLAGGELGRSLLLEDHRFLSHIFSPP